MMLFLLFIVTRPIVGGPCNGHGTSSLSSSSCDCEAPYAGDQCENCAAGYYGTALDGGVCYKACSSEDFLVNNFTFVGLGVQLEWLQSQHPHSPPSYCLWLVSPDSSSSTTFLQLAHLSSVQYFNSSLHHSRVFNFTIQFSSHFNLTKSSLPTESCDSHRDTVLIYDGLPHHLNALGDVHNRNDDSYVVNERIVASLTGCSLSDTTLHLSSQFLTFVYFYNTDVSHAGGFSATIKIDTLEPSEVRANSSCSCVVSPCDCTTDVSVYTLIDSLNQALEETTPTGHTHTCLGRMFHSSTYNPYSNSMYIFGGADLAYNVCPGAVIQVIVDDANISSTSERNIVSVLEDDSEEGPQGRYHHSMVLIPSESKQSSLLLIGGFVTKGVATKEVWLFNITSCQWTRKSDLPVPIAAHTATLTPDGLIVVVGGVSMDLAMHAPVMTYVVAADSWTVWPYQTLQLSGVYGHTSVYDVQSGLIWIFGGVAYNRPTARVSGTLYSLHVPSKTWNIVHMQEQIYPRLFHSMVLYEGMILIYGGLQSQSGELKSSYPCGSLTVVKLNDNSTSTEEKLSAAVSGFLPKRWGHSSAVISGNRVFIAGGAHRELIQSIDVLHNIHHLCSLATTMSQCHSLSCIACGNVSDSSLIGCFADNICSELDGIQLLPSSPSPATCGLFRSCKECLIGDVSQTLNCSWCLCDNATTCTLPSECPCQSADILGRCVLEECKYPDCRGCLSDPDCAWLGARVRSNTLVHDLLNVSYTYEEWGCFTSFINNKIIEAVRDFSLDVCPISCSRLTSCSECVMSNNSHGGSLTCVWASYSNECMSEDTVPLLCATNTCGAMVSSPAQCPLLCAQRQSCRQCQSSPECAWMPGQGSQYGVCLRVTDVEDLSVGKFVDCADCVKGCEVHGHCSHSGQCKCDFGYVGVACNVSCLCNGFSNCANETEAGRSTCLDCLSNTQGAYCEQCKAFYVGSPDRAGGGCMSCQHFCTGNSRVCTDIQTSKHFIVEEQLFSGPREEEAVCVGCGNNTFGRQCNKCLPGYFDDTPNHLSSALICTKCNCNGHDVTPCDNRTGDCDCRDNTRSISTGSLNEQCSRCIFGYMGNPINGSQCYQELQPDNTANYTLALHNAIFVAVKGGVNDNSRPFVSILVQKGLVDIYISYDSSAIQYVRTNSGGRHIVVSERHQVVERVKRGVEFIEGEAIQRSKRDAFGAILSSTEVNNVFKYRTSGRFSLLINNETGSTSNERQYIAMIALENSTALYFNYIQHKPTPQSSLTFMVTITLFIFVSLVIISVVKTIICIKDQLHRTRMKQLQRRRAYRPFHSIQLLLHPKGLNAEEYLKMEKIYYISNENKRSKKSKYCVKEVTAGSITVQPMSDQTAEIHSMIVQGPSSRSSRYTLLAGIALVHSTTCGQTQTETPLQHSSTNINKVHTSLQDTSEQSSQV